MPEPVGDLDGLWRPRSWHRRVGRAGPARDRGALVAVLVVAAAWNVAGNLVLPSWSYVPVNLVLSAVVVVLARRGGCTWEQLGLHPARLARGALVGLVAAVVVAAVIGAALAVPAGRDALAEADVARRSLPGHLATGLVRIPFGTALAEELLFRGAVLGLALRRRPVGGAVAVSAALFGLWHVVPALEGGTGAGALVGLAGTLVATTAAGLAFAWLRLRANSVLAPVVTHAATNALAYAAAVVAP